MTLEQKLQNLKKAYPEIYQVIFNNLPNLVEDPEHPTAEDIEKYNLYLDAIQDDIVYQLHHATV